MDMRKPSAALLVCLCFGSIHAYGVLLAPIEQWLGISRTIASLGYAIAIAALTAGVYLNGWLDVLSPRLRLLGCGIMGALGLLITAGSSTAVGLLFGYGLLFGLANGVGYSLSLVIAAEAMPGREPQAMGLATAAYGLGAVLSAEVFAAAMPGVAAGGLLLVLAPVILFACGIGAWLVTSESRETRPRRKRPSRVSSGAMLVLWAGYLLGAFSGLMILAHAPAIAQWRTGADGGNAGVVSSLVSFGSVAGGYLGGVAYERMPGRLVLALPVLLQAALLAVLPFIILPAALLFVFTVAGLCYGALIAAVPAEVRRLAGPDSFSVSYGKVFTAWGIAGILGPVTAGALYDLTLGYGTALAAAAGVSLLSGLFFSSLGRLPGRWRIGGSSEGRE